MRRTDRWPQWLLFGLLLCLAGATRRWGWESWSLWLDEAMQVDYTRRGLLGLFEALVADGTHPPLDYLVTLAVRQVSDSDAALRTPALLWGIGAAAALFLAMRREPRGAVGSSSCPVSTQTAPPGV